MPLASGQRRRLGHITKQGNSLLRFLLLEAAQITVRSDHEWRSKYFHLAMRRGRKIATSGDGAETRRSSVLDVAQGMGLRAVKKVRFTRGTIRESPGCAVEHRVIDWVSRSPFTGEFEVVIMIEGVTEEMHGSN